MAKDKPGSLTYASAGNGSAYHLAGELCKSATGLGDNAMALRAYSSIAEIAPNRAALLNRADKLQPQSEPAHYSLMMAYRNSGDLEAAKREKTILDQLQKPSEGEFSDFLKKLGEKPPKQ